MSFSSGILVVTPTLGESPFLDQSVAGVAAIPAPVMHVISAPAAAVPALQRRFPRVRVVSDAGRAGGIYGALNAALGSVANDWGWFTYINDDDLLLPGFARLLARHLARSDPAGVAYGDVDLINEEGRVLSRVTTERSPGWIPALLQQGISPLMQQGMIISREAVRRLGGFDTRYRLCADLDFWLRAYAAGERLRYYPLTIAAFRVRRAQLSSNTALTIREQKEIVARHLPRLIPRAVRLIARFRYRLLNLPRYVGRMRSGHWGTSYRILAAGSGETR